MEAVRSCNAIERDVLAVGDAVCRQEVVERIVWEDLDRECPQVLPGDGKAKSEPRYGYRQCRQDDDPIGRKKRERAADASSSIARFSRSSGQRVSIQSMLRVFSVQHRAFVRLRLLVAVSIRQSDASHRRL